MNTLSNTQICTYTHTHTHTHTHMNAGTLTHTQTHTHTVHTLHTCTQCDQTNKIIDHLSVNSETVYWGPVLCKPILFHQNISYAVMPLRSHGFSLFTFYSGN